MTYIRSNKDQNWLLPLSIKDMMPKNHICFLVEEFVDTLDFSTFDTILIQGMLSRIRSSRKLAAGCRENFVIMYLSEKT